MLFLLPKELYGKVGFKYMSVYIKEGVVLTEDELKIYKEFKKNVEYELAHPFE